MKTLAMIKAEADVYFKHGVAGKSVLDIGAWDGAFSFEAERRGARDVLATDDFCWTGKAWNGAATKAGFDYAHKRLKSRVRSQVIDVPAITPDALGGQFDVVLMLGVLYHVKDVLACLEAAASVTNETLVIETVTGLNDYHHPVMRYLVPGEIGGDKTNFFVPNIACISAMLTVLGFNKVACETNPLASVEHGIYNRHIFHATR